MRIGIIRVAWLLFRGEASWGRDLAYGREAHSWLDKGKRATEKKHTHHDESFPMGA